MGDRCYLHITMSKEDMPRFGTFAGCKPGERWWNDDLQEPAPGLKTVGVVDANYAWSKELAAAAESGIVFLGGHDAGSEYGPHAFAGVDNEYTEVPVSAGGLFAVEIDSALRVRERDLRMIKAYLHARDRARAVLGMRKRTKRL